MPLGEKKISILLPKIVLTFHCLNKLSCSSDLKYFADSRPSASNFKSFSQSLEHFFLTVGQNNFGNKIQVFFHYLHHFRNLSHLKRSQFGQRVVLPYRVEVRYRSRLVKCCQTSWGSSFASAQSILADLESIIFIQI
jgi:hypothetical protein